MKNKILVADDVLMERQVLTTLLEDEFDVTAVADGEAAVRELDAHAGEFACLLLDIVMPKLDGFGVLAHMRAKGWRTPVIALTSITDSEDHIRCYEAGVSELLEKPYDRKILRYKVKRMIERAAANDCPNLETRTLATTPDSKLDSVSFKLVLLKAFQQDFSSTLANLKKAIAEHDEKGLHDASHTFSGIEANLKVLLSN